MLVISLTAIPPRFDQLPRVLAALSTQGAARVVLVTPKRYARFPPTARTALPALPDSIWMGKPWSTALKSMADGVFYALVTGAVFASFWPGAAA